MHLRIDNTNKAIALLDEKNLDLSKLKQIADDILKWKISIWNRKIVSYRVENNVRNGKIACNKQFFLFSQCFPQLYIFSGSERGIVW